MKKRILSIAFAVIFSLSSMLCANITVQAEETKSVTEFQYKHDPMLNANAAKDILVDAYSIYGYVPNPESSRLGSYADYDWSDSTVVNKAREDRIAYHDDLKEMYVLLDELRLQNKSTEEIARTISKRRNEIRLESYGDDLAGLQKAKESNLKNYGNEFGPTPDSLYDKYGSWERVIEKAFSPNLGMDACLGLYDMYYDEYVALGLIDSSLQPVLARIEAANALENIFKQYGSLTQNNKYDDGTVVSIYCDKNCIITCMNGEAVGYAGLEDGFGVSFKEDGSRLYSRDLYAYEEAGTDNYLKYIVNSSFDPCDKVTSYRMVDGLLEMNVTTSKDDYAKMATAEDVELVFDGYDTLVRTILLQPDSLFILKIDYTYFAAGEVVSNGYVESFVYNSEKPDVSALYSATHGYDRMVSVKNINTQKVYSVSVPYGVAVYIYKPDGSTLYDNLKKDEMSNENDYSKSKMKYLY